MKKLLITGYMRTGTTFLANFLNSQKKCLVYRDFLRTIFVTSRQLGIKSFLAPLDDRQKNILLSELKAESWASGIGIMDGLTKNFSNLGELYENALYLMKGDKDYKVVGSKVTVVGDWLLALTQETDVYVIYIYRDIRDVLLSAKNRFTWYNLIKFIINLQKDLEKSFKIENKRFFLLKFEDLILNTDSVLNDLSGFLDCNITKNVDIAKDREIAWMHNSAFHDLDHLFDKNACYRWRRYKGSKEVKYCEILIGGLLERLEYDIEAQKYSLPDRFLAYKDFYIQKFKIFGAKILSKFA